LQKALFMKMLIQFRDVTIGSVKILIDWKKSLAAYSKRKFELNSKKVKLE